MIKPKNSIELVCLDLAEPLKKDCEYLLSLEINNKVNKFCKFSSKSGSKVVEIKQKFTFDNLLQTISFSMTETDYKSVPVTYNGEKTMTRQESTTLGQSSLACKLLPKNEKIETVIKVNFIYSNFIKIHTDPYSTEIFDRYIQNESAKKNASSKSVVPPATTNTNYTILDLASGSNAENFNLFVRNMSYLRDILNEIIDLFTWKNEYKTFSIMCMLTLGIIYPYPFFLIFLPLFLIFFHLNYKNEMVKNFTYKNVSIDRVANLHLIMWVIELTNIIISGYENIVEVLQSMSSEFVKDVYFNVFVVVFGNCFIIIFYYYGVYISIKVLLIIFLWSLVLLQYPPFVAFLLVLSNISKKLIVENVSERYLKYFTLKEEKSIIESVKNYSKIPQKVLVSESKESSVEALKYEIYENERWWIGFGFTKKLFRNEKKWSRADTGESSELESVCLPNGYSWMNDWKVERNQVTDKEGWEYATDFKGTFGENKMGKYVRRRKWVRYAKK